MSVLYYCVHGVCFIGCGQCMALYYCSRLLFFYKCQDLAFNVQQRTATIPLTLLQLHVQQIQAIPHTLHMNVLTSVSTGISMAILMAVLLNSRIFHATITCNYSIQRFTLENLP